MSDAPPVSKTMLWIGRVLSALPVLMLAMSASMKLMKSPMLVEGFAHLGWPESVAITLGIVELSCAILYAIPQTAVLGAILVTGYLGGAVATHVRIGEPFHMPIILGVIAWGGLYFRDARIRALIPLRS